MSIRWFSSAAKLDKKKPFEFTVNLPKTLFPMRANACVNELKYRERTTSYLYQWQAKQSRDKEFVIHDGPPYANGDLHMGTLRV